MWLYKIGIFLEVKTCDMDWDSANKFTATDGAMANKFTTTIGFTATIGVPVNLFAESQMCPKQA